MAGRKLKLVSWNVNGIRAAQKKGFFESMKTLNPDIICLQETKAEESQVDMNDFSNYHAYWNSAEKKGYSGTLMLAKQKPMNVSYGLGIEKHDKEGRVITAEYKKFYLVTVYTPNSKRGLERLDYRENEWDIDFLKYCKELEKSKPVIFCGDLNVAHKEIDLANPKTNKKNAGFTEQERKGFDNIISEGFIDTFRHFNDEPHQYSWWSYRSAARERNIGWRIDYFCASESLEKNLERAEIHQDILGSDHCPVSLCVKGLD